MRQVLSFFKKEKVLSIALLLAIFSAFIVHPDAGYRDYIDFRTLAILFGLMLVVKGFQDIGLLDRMNRALFGNIKNSRILSQVLIFLCFFISMLMTNDVALITFVPLAILTLRSCRMQKLTIRVVVMQTLAANLGCMMTPFGSPQNIYLFSNYPIGIGEFFKTVLPLSGLSFILLLAGTVVLIPKESVSFQLETDHTVEKQKSFTLPCYVILFVLNLLVVFRVVSWIPVLIITILVAVLMRKWHLFRQVDYALLATFVGFFIFVGNMGRVPFIRDSISQLLLGREVLISALFSQFLSNVPAAILLSEFTENGAGLIAGTNIGGLGTLIASMASLISYKLYATTCENADKGKYFRTFTLYNVVLFVILLIAGILLSL